MSDLPFVIVIVILLFAGIGLILLVLPSLFLRLNPNPFMPDSPWNRVQMRGIGLFLCLFVLLIFSGGGPESGLLEKFHRNILVALYVFFFALPILMWILWRFSVRSFVRRSYINGTLNDLAWERRMTLIFCSLLSLIVAIALALAAKGHHL